MADKSTRKAPQKKASSAKGASGAAARNRSAGKGKAPAGKATRKKGGWFKRLMLWTTVLVLLLALVATVAGFIFYQRTELPDPNKDFQTNTTFMYYRDGKTKLGSFAVQNRQSLDYAAMPENIKDAVVAAENRTFWTDRGISPSGIARAGWTIVRGGEMQGGSTITQQYIKILYLTSDRTMTRKLKELALAVKLGKEVPKEEILEGYLNTIYFGRGAYGIQAAARNYFNTEASKLTIAQAAVLASVINSPAIYDPDGGKANVQRLLERYRYVLDGMLEAGKITQAEHDVAWKALPKFPDIPSNLRWGGSRGFLLKMVQNELLAKGFSQDQIDGGGLQITTTFDNRMQDAAVKVGHEYEKKVGAQAGGAKAKQIHPAIASVEVGSGEVLAIYGGHDYVKNSRNWATTARPAASTFKTWAAVAGIRGGMSLRTVLNGNTFTPRGDGVHVQNDFAAQYGPVTLRRATQSSINTAFVDLTQRLDDGANQVIKAANDAGIAKGAGWEPNNRVALGMAEVSPLANAGGYATLANDGVQVANHVVREVKDRHGKVVYTAEAKGKQTIEQGIARDVTSALKSVVDQGTGGAVRGLGFEVAGKTGTNGITRDGKDDITSAWFVAYTKQISTAVMYVAGDDGTHSLNPYAPDGNNQFFGGGWPAQTWADYMRLAMEGIEPESFDQAECVNCNGSEQGSRDESQSDESPTQEPSAEESAPTEEASAEPSAESSAPAPSQQPTSAAPSASQPAPETSAPPATQEAPATSAPATAPPATQAPATTAPPATQPAPTATAPATQKPANQKPAGNAPEPAASAS